MLVRTVKLDNTPRFVGKDVSNALEYRDAGDMVRCLDDDEKAKCVVPTSGGAQEMLVINEPGLYHAIFMSRKESAKGFRKWVTGEVLPALRKNGAYVHYGIYCSDTCIIHYAVPVSQTIGHATVHATDLRGFLRDAPAYFVLDFPRPYDPPVRIGNQGSVPHTETVSEELARHLQTQYGYHLYTPEETVQRAKSRLGETNYKILTNNCEHFVIWCKTGVNESMQVTGMLHTLGSAHGFQFRRPVYR